MPFKLDIIKQIFGFAQDPIWMEIKTKVCKTVFIQKTPKHTTKSDINVYLPELEYFIYVF